MVNWFYTDKLATQQGPVDGATLLDLNRRGDLRARSLVWREGMPQWTPFRDVAAELFAEEEGVVGDEGEGVEIGVCAHSGRVYPLKEMLPYGSALIGPEEKEDFVRRLMEGAAVEIEDATEKRLDYVGFWWRTLAATLDYMVKMIPASLCMVPYYLAAMIAGASAPDPEAGSIEELTGGMTALMIAAYGLGLLGNLALSIFYETWMVGRYQATLGKIIVGAKVVNPDGSRLTYKRAFIRWLAKKPLNMVLVWLPSTLGFALVVALMAGMAASGGEDGATFVFSMLTGLVVYAGLLLLCSAVYWMAAFDPEKRTLHDRVSATRVVKK